MSPGGNCDRRSSLPVLYTRGTHYDVGFDMGRTFRGIIEDFFASNKEFIDSALKGIDGGETKHAYDSTLESLQKNFPQYIRELQGIADGARVPFMHLMVMHMVNPPPPAPPNLGCTSVSLNKDGEILLGHTEDAQSEMLNHIYVIEAEIIEDEPQGRYGRKKEHFTALCYAGEVPGFCMGYNRHGVAFSVNVLRPKNIAFGKTPRHFLCRALLGADSMAAVHEVLRDTGVGAADGFSANVIKVNEDGSRLFQNFEVAPAKEGEAESRVSILPVESGGSLVHANIYLHLDTEENTSSLIAQSSVCRHARADALPPPTSRESLLNILGDEENPVHPIFRTSDKSFVTTTLGLFDIPKRKWTFWMNSPKKDAPLFSQTMTFEWDQ